MRTVTVRAHEASGAREGTARRGPVCSTTGRRGGGTLLKRRCLKLCIIILGLNVDKFGLGNKNILARAPPVRVTFLIFYNEKIKNVTRTAGARDACKPPRMGARPLPFVLRFRSFL